MNYIEPQTFQDFFSPEYLNQYFRENLIIRNGGGKDGMTPIVFWKNYQKQIPIIAKKCREGNYHFATYNEQLILKGRDKLPRVISIPTIRDRLVLGVLNKYLQKTDIECVCHDVPNRHIKVIKDFIKRNCQTEISFLKTDFKSFYDNINQKKLLNKLSSKIKENHALLLIKKAIQTPTGPVTSKSLKINKNGVPQGLAISNILAGIYMEHFDKFFSNSPNTLYIRYVDDILILQTNKSITPKNIKQYLVNNKLKLTLSKEKTEKGVIGINTIDFIGYVFTAKCISIRKKNINNLINRLANLCTMFKKEYDNSNRLLFNGNNEQYKIYFEKELNMLISGFKYESHCYGWLPYYRSMNDIALLYHLDIILKEKLLPPEINPSSIHSFVQSYYELMNYGGGRLILDFNKMTTIPEKTAFLRKMGILRLDKDYSNKDINLAFERYIRHKKKQVEENIGYI